MNSVYNNDTMMKLDIHVMAYKLFNVCLWKSEKK